jgi:nicotinate dehydrogenase subunit B
MTPEGLGTISRRDFIQMTGSGLLLVFTVDFAAWAQEPAQIPSGRRGYPTDFNAYLHIATDGRVTCLVGKVELGQGAMTALPQLLAEELDVELSQIDIVMGDTDICPWDMGTFGSLSIRQFGPVLKAAAAEARAILIQFAAEKLQVPADRLIAKAGVITDSGDPAKRVAYGDLAAGKKIERRLGKPPLLKPVSSYTVVGKPAARRDGNEKVTGKATYAGDIVPPGALHARILRPPAHGAKLTAIETKAAAAVPGVTIVDLTDAQGNATGPALIAVLHPHRDEADKARDLFKASFESPAPGVNDVSIFDHLVKAAPPGQTVGETGSLQDGVRLAKSSFQQTYLNSYVAHAPIETHSAVAAFEGDRVTIWASTQAPFSVKSQVAAALKLPAENVHVIMPPYVGGGFGGKSSGPQAVEAALLARKVGKPIRVIWDRAEEFFYDTFRPAAVVKIMSGLDEAGKITVWDYESFCAGDREARQFYNVPNQRTISHGGWQDNQPAGLHPFGVGPWRAPSVNTHTFARESHIDTMAAKAGIDPVEFRMNNLTDPRMRRVLETAVKRFGWVARPAPSRRGVGVACAIYSGTYVATCIELKVDPATGGVQAVRVVCAQDMGVVVNPAGAHQQMEGCITMGLGYALTEEVRFSNGQVLDHNFDTYEVPRFSWVPRIETILIDEPNVPASGGGEPPIVCMGAVVANAIFDAVGARLLQLPLTPARVKGAMTKGT